MRPLLHHLAYPSPDMGTETRVLDGSPQPFCLWSRVNSGRLGNKQGIALLVTGMLKAFVLRQTREVPQFTTAAVNKQNQDPLTPTPGWGDSQRGRRSCMFVQPLPRPPNITPRFWSPAHTVAVCISLFHQQLPAPSTNRPTVYSLILILISRE